MVLAGALIGFRINLVPPEWFLTSNEYRDHILEPTVCSLATQIGEKFVLMHDSARPLIARTLKTFSSSTIFRYSHGTILWGLGIY